MPLAPGVRLGPYEVVSPLGAGGMGEVYKARDPRLGRDVAIKVLPPSVAADPARLHRFAQEARAVAALSHANILAIFDIGPGTVPFLVTELLEGETLRAVIERGPVPVRRATDIALQLVAGLAAAHGRGIVHRDLKPENVFLTRDGTVKILDFGLAKCETGLGGAADADHTMAATSAGVILGTVGYMAPEQIRGEPADPRSDIFAVGTVLYEMVSGQRAFHGDSPADTMSAVLREQPPDLVLRTGTPPAVARIVRRCLEKDAAERFQSARDVRFALEAVTDAPDASPAAPKAANQKSIAVLPFANMSADAENQYFSDGLAEELINALTRLPGLHVASRTSAFRFRGREIDIRQIGKELGVATVLEGSVRKSGNRLRITAQLINVADGYHVWSERYDREMADVFAIQDEIVEAIVKAIAPSLAGEAKAAIKRGTDNQEAYELYLKGRHHWHQRSPAALQTALRLFEQVTTLDRDYALAYAGIADCLAIIRAYGWFPASTCRARARDAIERAQSLDASLPQVNFSHGLYLFLLETNPDAALTWVQRAAALDPRMVEAQVYQAMIHAYQGHVAETLAYAATARRLDPVSPFAHFVSAISFCILSLFEEATDAARQVLELLPDSTTGLWPLGIALTGLGRIDPALAALERLCQLSRAPLYVGQLGLAYGIARRQDAALGLLNELDERASRGEYVAPCARLAIAIGLDDTTGIRGALTACVDDTTPAPTVKVSCGPFLERYRSDPEIDSLCGRIYRGL